MGREKIEDNHSEELDLIGYGLAKFAGSTKGTNEIANLLSGNRSKFFRRLVETGIARTTGVISTRQDNFDPFFGTKIGFVERADRYKPKKERIDSVVGSLNMEQYAEFIEAIIAKETGGTVENKQLLLINKAIAAVNGQFIVAEDNTAPIQPCAGGQEINEPKDSIDEQETIRQHIEVQWYLKQLGNRG